MTRLAILGSTVAVLALVGWTAGIAGLAYLPFWAAAALPGVLVGRRLFGSHPAGWVAGAAAGYALTCLVVWAVVAAGIASRTAFLLAWAVELAVAAALAGRLRGPVVSLRAWTPRDTVALSGVLLLVPALMAAPYRSLGALDDQGHRTYRAYFTADFVWHVALTSELARFDMPPRNPYMGHRDLHYYWTYFLVPAAVTALTPAADVEAALKTNAIATAVLLLAAIFLAASTAGARPAATALGVALVVLASSAEGVAVAADLLARGRPLAALRDVNVDAVTAWWFNGLRIDSIHRTMYYTPQHGLSCALGLLALVPAAAAGARATYGSVLLSGVLLGLATTLNPFLGAVFSGIYGVSVLLDGFVTRAPLRALAQWPAAIPPALAVLWGVANAMGEGAGEALSVGWVGFARNRPLATLALGLGPALLPALLGLLPNRRLPSQPARVAATALAAGLFLLYFVVLSERSWVGFRAGQVLLATLPLGVARLFEEVLARGFRWTAALLAALIMALGLPTTAVDACNAADTSNRRMGPGFPWTLTVSPPQQEALDWLQAHTPPTAIVQAEPMVRGRGHWSFIPTFARRRTSAALPISLLPVPEYEERSRRVQAIFTDADPGTAHAAARRLGIDYLWVDGAERGAYPEGVARLDASPHYFEPVFRNAEVTIYAVR